MKTFVVNLESAHVRRERMTRDLTRTGIEFEFFRAVTPADEPQQLFAGFDRRTMWQETGRSRISATEIACYASHIRLWQKCIDINEPVVVLEDDAEPTSNLPDVYGVLEPLVRRFGFIRLEPPRLRPNYFRGGRLTEAHSLIAAQAGSVRLLHPTYVSLGAVAYALSPAAAAVLLQVSLQQTLRCPVDNVFRRIWTHRQPMFYTEPAAFRIGADNEKSQISGRDEIRSDIKIVRKLRKFIKRPYQWWARQASRRESTRVRRLLQIE
jgi:glycosyl transferase family 25